MALERMVYRGNLFSLEVAGIALSQGGQYPGKKTTSPESKSLLLRIL
jgi:hypothetical protein